MRTRMISLSGTSRSQVLRVKHSWLAVGRSYRTSLRQIRTVLVRTFARIGHPSVVPSARRVIDVAYGLAISGYHSSIAHAFRSRRVNRSPKSCNDGRFDICNCSVHDITRLGAAHADDCPMAD